MSTLNGSKKCKAQKNLQVNDETQNPPQSQITNNLPFGKTLIRLIITVAPQKDICPQGKTQPKKAEPITKALIIQPLNQGPGK